MAVVTASLAEALAALTDARAARNRAEDERDAALTAKDIADVQRDAAEAERDELRAALDNERGAGDGPSEDWIAVGDEWRSPTSGPYMARVMRCNHRWQCGVYTVPMHYSEHDTAREGMRAADAARGQP